MQIFLTSVFALTLLFSATSHASEIYQSEFNLTFNESNQERLVDGAIRFLVSQQLTDDSPISFIDRSVGVIMGTSRVKDYFSDDQMNVSYFISATDNALTYRVKSIRIGRFPVFTDDQKSMAKVSKFVERLESELLNAVR